VDPLARFLFVAPSDVPAVAERFKAEPFDTGHGFWNDRDENCTFDIMLDAFGGMVAASIWLFALPPAQTTTLIVAYALLVQGFATWRLRDAIDYKRLLPFVLGSAIGIPAGVFMLEIVRPAYIRTAVGVLLIAFSLYNLTR